MAPHSSTFAWKIPWTKEPGRLQSMGSLESDMTEWLPFHFSLSCIGEGNGNPLQYSCLENPRDRGAWWAAIYGVAQSQTRLKWLSSSSSIVKVMGSPGGSDCKDSACNAGDQVRSLGWEDPLEKEVATQSSIPAWKIPWTEKLVRLQSLGLQRIGYDLINTYCERDTSQHI